ncbi:hypothetical protein IWQ60_006393, partial [Tieghemiomyces parasiticus]
MQRQEQDFVARKRAILAEIASHTKDKSPKGFIDEPIIPLLDLINRHPDYVTTSSCSGRIAVFADHQLEPSEAQAPATTGGLLQPTVTTEGITDDDTVDRSHGQWLMVTHDPLDLKGLSKSVREWVFAQYAGRILAYDGSQGTKAEEEESSDAPLPPFATFKFEPLIIHVQARTLQAARKLLTLAVDFGFRNSGLKVSDKRYMLALRSSLKLDVPVATIVPSFTGTAISPAGDNSPIHLVLQPLVPDRYLQTLLRLGNAKFRENLTAIDGFKACVAHACFPGGKILLSADGRYTDVRDLASMMRPVGTSVETKEERRERKRLEGLRRQEQSRSQ